MAFTLNGAFGMPAGMQQLLQEKYRQSGMVAAAQANQANAVANVQNQNAKQVAPLAQAQIKEQGSATRLNNENADMVKPIGFSNIRVNDSIVNKNNADALFTDKQRSRYDDKVNADIYQGVAAGDFNRAGAAALGQEMRPSTPASAGTYKPFAPASDAVASGLNFGLGGGSTVISAPAPAFAPVNIAPTIQNAGSGMIDLGESFYNKTKSLLSGFDDEKSSFRLKRGIARVPGKGAGDKVPAMLEPGEAVLNKHAADKLGRGKIAAANAKGNEQRSKQDALKIAQMLKAMSSGMV